MKTNLFLFAKKEDSYEKKMFTHDIEVSATNLGGVRDTCLSPAICLCFSKSARGWWTGHMWNRHNGFVLHSCGHHVPIFTVLLFEGKQAESTRMHRSLVIVKSWVWHGYSFSPAYSRCIWDYSYIHWVSILRDLDFGWDKTEVRVVSWDGTKPGKVATSFFFLLLFP